MDTDHVCPFLDEPQVDFCRQVTSLKHMETATDYCLGNYEACPLYRMQRALMQADVPDRSPTRRPA